MSANPQASRDDRPANPSVRTRGPIVLRPSPLAAPASWHKLRLQMRSSVNVPMTKTSYRRHGRDWPRPDRAGVPSRRTQPAVLSIDMLVRRACDVQTQSYIPARSVPSTRSTVLTATDTDTLSRRADLFSTPSRTTHMRAASCWGGSDAGVLSARCGSRKKPASASTCLVDRRARCTPSLLSSSNLVLEPDRVPLRARKRVHFRLSVARANFQ